MMNVGYDGSDSMEDGCGEQKVTREREKRERERERERERVCVSVCTSSCLES